MKKSILTAFGLAVALAFSAPLFSTTDANAAAQAQTASPAAKQPMKKHHHKKIHYKKNHHKKSDAAATKPS